MDPDPSDDLVDLRHVLEIEFLRLMRPELDALRVADNERRATARKVIARAESTAGSPTREAVTIAFHRAVAVNREVTKKFMDARRDEIRAPLERRYLSLLELELDALSWPLDDRRQLAEDAVFEVTKEAWSGDTSLEEAFRARVQADRASMRKSIDEREPGALEEKAAMARTRMALQWDFQEEMRDAFDRAGVSEADRHDTAEWFLVLLGAVSRADTPQALRHAFERHVVLERAATTFLRDPANAGRTCSELDPIRSLYGTLYRSAVTARLGRDAGDPSAEAAWTDRAFEGALRSVRVHPWLPLHVAFRLQLDADLIDLDKFDRASAIPGPVVLPSPTPDLDQKRLAIGWIVEAETAQANGDYARAETLLQRARRTSLGINDPAGVARARLALARLQRARGWSAAARSEYGEALALYRRLGQDPTVAMIEAEVDGLPT